MTGFLLSAVHESRRKPLAACVASIFALTAPTATLAATVTSCLDDGGGGTLRSVIAAAAEGGTVDFTGLSCVNSKITLSGSSIPIAQNSLTIDGTAAASQLTIDASALPGYSDSRVFTHSGTGTLTISDLVLTGGHVNHIYYPSFGGCLSSAASVVLNSVTVTDCVTANIGAFTPTGGAVYVNGNLTLNNSTVSYSSANGVGSAVGGGVYVKGNLSLQKSSISHNSATAGKAYGGGAFVHGFMTANNGATIDHNLASAGTGNAAGGGVYVDGGVSMSNATIVYSSAYSMSEFAAGGGLLAKGVGGGGITLVTSNVTHNTANGGLGSDGGGIRTLFGTCAISYTTVAYNKAHGPAARGGGLSLYTEYNTIASSTISNNTSDYNGGGVWVQRVGSAGTFELKNSAVSNNFAGNLIGGMSVRAGTAIKLWNSTIAFNTAGSAAGGHSPGVHLNAVLLFGGAVDLQSTLISNNSVGSYQLDLTAESVTFNGGALAIPANNLIRATKLANLPTDTKQNVCPRLEKLRDNGGLTYTHALLSHSPAIDTGNDSFLLLPFDQRGSAAVNGTANYSRLSGAGALTDIGAYEVQQDDIVFNTDFDDCPPLSF